MAWEKAVKYFLTFLTFLLVFPFVSGAQTEEKPKYAPGKEKHKNKTDEFGRKQGTWLAFNLYGEKISETPWINDHKEGVEKRFYSGKLSEETEYLGGIKDGQYNKYFYSGQVAIEGQYAWGRKDGKWTKYFEDGSIRQEGSYKSGKKDGVWKTYNRKGTVTSQVTYKDDQDIQILQDTKKKTDEKKPNDQKKKDQGKSPPVKSPTSSAASINPPISPSDSLKKKK